MAHQHHILTVLLVMGLAGVGACKPKDDGGTDGDTTVGSTGTGDTEGSDATTGATTGTTGTGGTQGGSSSGETDDTSDTEVDMCAGPEHEEFKNALCPYKPPDCGPADLLGEEWETYCSDMGIGPVGEGECGCTPQAVFCGPDDLLCCCLPGDVGLDP